VCACVRMFVYVPLVYAVNNVVYPLVYAASNVVYDQCVAV